MMPVPDLKDHTFHQKMIDGVKVDAEAVKDLMATPALNGAIPIAIFDDARKQPFYSADIAEEFFNMFATFRHVSCLPRILQYVLDSMMDTHPTDPSTCSCFVRQPVIGIDLASAEFPMALASSLDRLKTSKERTADQGRLSRKISSWMEPICSLEDLDPGIRKVLMYTLRKLESR